MGRRNHAKGSLPYQFVGIPKDVLTMTEFQMLPASAKALMLDLMAQYTGKNNGRLCPAFEVMQRCGWTSKTTLIRAKEALTGASFVVRTRKGHPPRTTDWFGFTWWRLDYEKSMDIDPRIFPHLNFLQLGRDPNTGRELAKKREVWSRNGTDVLPKVVPRGIETGPMGVAK